MVITMGLVGLIELEVLVLYTTSQQFPYLVADHGNAELSHLYDDIRHFTHFTSQLLLEDISKFSVKVCRPN